jgi:hypothetical protein
MTGTIESKPGRRQRAWRTIAFAALCVCLVGAVAVSSAGAKQATVLGKTKKTPAPNCPRECEAVGSVTGFPLETNGKKQPMKVRRNGRLVAWAIDLSRPKKSQRDFFGTLFKSDQYGKTPTARLAVIKHRRGTRAKYRLLRQGPVAKLSSFLGDKQVFTLDSPLRVRKGQIVALTVPTWASNFASGIGERTNRWRASRTRRNCSPRSGELRDIKAFARKSRPQQKVGSVRGYGCDYTAARLLYWAYFVRG